MDRKLAAVLILILLVGAGIGYSISMPQTSKLQTEISTWTTNFRNLNTTHTQLKDDYSSLNNSHNELIAQHNTLQSNYSSLNSTSYELTLELSALIADYNHLNESHVDLSQQYEDLLFHYNLINSPASNFTTIQDLQITLTTYLTTYYYKDPVSGNVTITYVNGTAFEGIFSIYVVPNFGGYGRTTYHQPTLTNGFAEFYLSPPVFQYGPGNYTIGIASISTVDGYVIASSLWSPSVQVEAK